jgi:phosphoesterase RecJ-like protein
VTLTSPRAAAFPARTAASVLTDAADARATIVLSGHVQPDADALGSTLALAEGLRRRGARVLTTFPDPFTLPASLGWLPGAEGLVPSSAVPSSPDVFVSLDAASPGRLGELAVLLDAAGTSVVVDHHASNPGFGDVRLIDGAAPATVTLVAELLDDLGVTVDAQLATCLYAGLAADTGSSGSATPGPRPTSWRPAFSRPGSTTPRSVVGCSTPPRSAGSACCRS